MRIGNKANRYPLSFYHGEEVATSAGGVFHKKGCHLNFSYLTYEKMGTTLDRPWVAKCLESFRRSEPWRHRLAS